MIIKSFNYKMPDNWAREHLAFKLWYFSKNYILPKLLGEIIIRKSEITFDILDRDKTVIKYKGDSLGVVCLVGNEMTFVSKDE